MRRAFQAIRERQEELLGVIAVSFGLVMVVGPILHLSFWQSLAVTVPVAVAIVVGFSRWLASVRRRQNQPLRTETHPVFGEVRLFADHWDAMISGAPFSSCTEVAGDSGPPSPQQVGTFGTIQERYETLVRSAIDALTADLAQLRPAIGRGELVLSSIWIDSDGDNFSFYFDVPTRRAEVTDGFYADFTGFEIHEAGWVH